MSTFVNADEFEQDDVDRAIEEHNISSEDLGKMQAMEKDMASEDEPEAAASTTAASSGSSSRGPVPGGVMPAGAMPTTKTGALSQHAGEFWFPESRNCPCCKGFKHGCKCRVGPVTCCQDAGCTTTAAAEETVAKVEEKPRHKPVIVFKNNATPAPAAAAAAPVPKAAPAPIDTAAPAGGTDNRQPCTFFASPQGCRFGASCRFKHGNDAPGASAGGSPVHRAFSPGGSPAGDGSCKFFAMGNCQYGTNCRFTHS